MQQTRTKAFLLISLLVILTVATMLRFTGLHWGIPTDEFAHRPFHPDEEWVMEVLGQVDPDDGDWNPESGHREGTLSFFLWTAEALGLEMVETLSTSPHNFEKYDHDYAALLYAGRVLVACADIITVLLIFLTVQLVTTSFWAPIIAAFAFAVTPFEVIHAHYMRAHTIANLFIVATIYFSFLFLRGRHTVWMFLAGLACGLSTASRYPSLAVIAVPVLVGFSELGLWRSLRQRDLKGIWNGVWNKLWVFIGLGVLIGFFVGAPFLFLDFEAAKPHLLEQAKYAVTSEFSLLQLLNLSRIWVYLSYLIPYGTLPFLWVLYYAATLLALLSYRRYRTTFPLLVFLGGFLYCMAKGYFSEPIFIRAVLPVFPIFAILTGIAWDILKPKGVIRIIALALVSLPLIASTMYSYAYTHAMSAGDPRVRLAQYLSNSPHKQLKVGVARNAHSYFVVLPALDSIKDKEILAVDIDDPEKTIPDVDFLILGALEVHDQQAFKRWGERLVNLFNYQHVKVFEAEPKLFGSSLSFPNNPHDMQYPLPRLIILVPPHKNSSAPSK